MYGPAGKGDYTARVFHTTPLEFRYSGIDLSARYLPACDERAPLCEAMQPFDLSLLLTAETIPGVLSRTQK